MKSNSLLVTAFLMAVSGCAIKPLTREQSDALTDYQVCRYMYTGFQRQSDSLLGKELANSYYKVFKERKLDCGAYEAQIRSDLAREAAENAAVFGAILGVTVGAAAASSPTTTNCTVIRGAITDTITCR